MFSYIGAVNFLQQQLNALQANSSTIIGEFCMLSECLFLLHFVGMVVLSLILCLLDFQKIENK